MVASPVLTPILDQKGQRQTPCPTQPRNPVLSAAAVAFYGPVCGSGERGDAEECHLTGVRDENACARPLGRHGHSGYPSGKAALQATSKTAEFGIYKDAPHGLMPITG